MHCKSSRPVSQVTIARSRYRIGYAATLGYVAAHWHKLILFGVLLLSACRATVAETDAVALPLADALPASWEALRDVAEVNIDGDEVAEYLLLFTYDASGTSTTRSFFSSSSQSIGPIGAVIYDAQVVTGTTPAESVSADKPANAFVPYAILPSYRRDAGQGFIATPGQRANVQAYPVSYRGLTQLEAVTADALIFVAGDADSETYLTFTWWQNRADGYGVTQLYAPGGFETAPFQAFGWAQWRQSPTAIRQIIAVHPLHDRNLLCRRFQYEWDAEAYNGNADPTQAGPIRYRKTDLGLQFCYPTPAHPFYPEGVVLAYLLGGNADLLDPARVASAVPDDQMAWLQPIVQEKGVVRVDDLASYATLTTTQEAPAQPGTPGTIGVCALIEVQVAGATQQVALYFTLRHEEPQFQMHTPDQLFIANVEAIPAPDSGVVVNCQAALGG